MGIRLKGVSGVSETDGISFAGNGALLDFEPGHFVCICSSTGPESGCPSLQNSSLSGNMQVYAMVACR